MDRRLEVTLLALILLGAFHVHLQRVLLQHGLCEVVESTDPADVLAFLPVLCQAVLNKVSGAPGGLPTENADESLGVSPLVSHQALRVVKVLDHSYYMVYMV